MNKLLHLMLIAGEESGDQLGAKLIDALRQENPTLRISGVGGRAMAARGLKSLFPMEDISVMGVSAVLRRLPLIVRRVYATVDAVIAAEPDGLVLIDSPDFTHAVAKRVRPLLGKMPILNYVSPSVRAWRPGRARTMRAYVDHILALLPFEPDAHRRLGGPACSYVGHPLIERLAELRPASGERPSLTTVPQLLVLPGSRRSEITRLMPVFGKTVAEVSQIFPELRIVLPAVPHVLNMIVEELKGWSVKPQVIVGEAEKWAAFRTSHAALAASGTVTLELALAGIPMVVAYKVSPLEAPLGRFIQVPTIVLPNLILGTNAVPEYLQNRCTPSLLTQALVPLLRDTAERNAQLEALQKLDGLMSLGPGETPSKRAAHLVLDVVKQRLTSPV